MMLLSNKQKNREKENDARLLVLLTKTKESLWSVPYSFLYVAN